MSLMIHNFLGQVARGWGGGGGHGVVVVGGGVNWAVSQHRDTTRTPRLHYSVVMCGTGVWALVSSAMIMKLFDQSIYHQIIYHPEMGDNFSEAGL